jgi:quercetin dioxygenase-like cupin family protein
METPTTPTSFVADVRDGAEPGPRGLGHSTVLSSPDVRVVVLTFEAGHVMKEHRAPKTLLLQALDGRLRITAGGEVTELVPGALLRLEASLLHEVEALEPSRLMLTLVG